METHLLSRVWGEGGGCRGQPWRQIQGGCRAPVEFEGNGWVLSEALHGQKEFNVSRGETTPCSKRARTENEHHKSQPILWAFASAQKTPTSQDAGKQQVRDLSVGLYQPTQSPWVFFTALLPTVTAVVKSACSCSSRAPPPFSPRPNFLSTFNIDELGTAEERLPSLS